MRVHPHGSRNNTVGTRHRRAALACDCGAPDRPHPRSLAANLSGSHRNPASRPIIPFMKMKTTLPSSSNWNRAFFGALLVLFVLTVTDPLWAQLTTIPSTSGASGYSQPIVYARQVLTDYAFQISLAMLVFGGVMWFFNRPAFTIGALVAAGVIYGGPQLANGIAQMANSGAGGAH